MRFITTSLIALGAASSALAQLSPVSIAESLLGELSPTCQATVLQLLVPTAPIYTCLNVGALLPILSATGSILPPLDMYLGDICGTSPCSNVTIYNASQAIITGCSSDLAKVGVANSTILDVFESYPLAREIACLKTSLPFNATNATLPITSSTYNSTNGTFCVTSILTEVSTYLGANLTNTYVDTLILGGNATALQLLEKIPPKALCSDCIFAGLDLIEEEYPQIGMVNISSNVTLNMYLDGMCNATLGNITMNGTLPKTIEEVAFNSTYPMNVTFGSNVTYLPGNNTVKPPAINYTAITQVSSAIASVTPLATSTVAAK